MSTTGKEKVIEMMQDIETAMLVTEDAHGHLRSRPMHTSQVDADGTAWFFTSEYSVKADEIAEEHNINLAYADKDGGDYLSVAGKAKIVTDQAKIDELWSDMLKAWFPEGKDSNRLALLCVKPVHAQYWDATSSKIVELFKIGTAIATGDTYDGGKNEKVNM